MQSAVLDMLAVAYAGPHAVKRMAQDARTSPHTTGKWWLRLTTPRADVLWRMARENQALRAEMLRALQGDAYADLVGTPGPASGAVVAPAGGTAAASAVERRQGDRRGAAMTPAEQLNEGEQHG